MANAGHIAPYLNGAEVPFTGSLPLGLSGKIEPSLQALQLRPGDQLTFITDGVVEARDAAGELFGFARARIICNEPVGEIVRRAQQFGQNDDITVLRVDYTAGRRQMFAIEKS
jgi:serine phosphatase RsbU (regulator of sigma subunit)